MRNDDIARRELIGHDIKFGNEKAKIIDETKNLLIVELEGGKRKRLLKSNNIFEIISNDKIIRIDGKKLLSRPEERLKIKC